MERRWTIQDSADLYHIPQWGAPYFTVNEDGNIACSAGGEGKRAVDLRRIVDHLVRRGIHTPILLRINDLLGARVGAIAKAFNTARDESSYTGTYTPAMPIKVNQQRHVVQELLARGAKWGLSLEAGSKPELLAAIALVDDDRPLIICNGYKDRQVHRDRPPRAAPSDKARDRSSSSASRSSRSRSTCLGAQLGIRPRLGVRAKLSAQAGSASWARPPAGDQAPSSGSPPTEIDRASLDRLKEARAMLDCARASCTSTSAAQISSRSCRSRTPCARPAGSTCELRGKMGDRRWATIDVGGGLAVDYDGSQDRLPQPRRITSMQEYAYDVVCGLIHVRPDQDAELSRTPPWSARAAGPSCAHHVGPRSSRWSAPTRFAERPAAAGDPRRGRPHRILHRSIYETRTRTSSPKNVPGVLPRRPSRARRSAEQRSSSPRRTSSLRDEGPRAERPLLGDC